MFKLIKKCRVCNSTKIKSIINLGSQPPANSLKKKIIKQLVVPLNVLRCGHCATLQLSATVRPSDLFSKYLWVTRTSESVKKYRDYFVKKIINSSPRNKRKLLEVASNDGFFLEEFKKKGFEVLGVDPAKNIAKKANAKKINTIPQFFNEKLSKLIKNKYFSPNIVVCRNVIPHVENVHSVIKGISEVLVDDGKAYIEFHYAENLNKNMHYDYIYHEHIFYFTLFSITNLLKIHGLNPVDYFNSPISGGSLVLIVSKTEVKMSNNLKKLIQREIKTKINTPSYWKNFKKKCVNHKNILNKVIINLLEKKLSLSGYGASARSSTLLNYSKINNKHLKYIFDKNKMKSDLYTAGSNILIKKPSAKLISKVDCIIILAWNFQDEIVKFLKKKIKFKGSILSVLPRVRVI